MVFTAALDGRAYARHGTTTETRLTVIDRVPAGDPDRLPGCHGIAADISELLALVDRHVPPRPSLAATPGLPSPAVTASRASSLPGVSPRITPSLHPVKASVSRAAAPAVVELVYETCEGAPGEVGGLSESLYEAYTLQAVRIPGARPHPTCLVQSAAMASVDPRSRATARTCRSASSAPACSRTPSSKAFAGVHREHVPHRHWPAAADLDPFA